MRRNSTKFKYKFDETNSTREQRGDRAAWCEEWIPNQNNWDLYMGTWRFRYKKDYAKFLLRWT